MPEAVRSRALDAILNRDEDEKPFTKERQHTAQAFTLHVEWKDGRRTEGFAWAHYLGYRWADEGANEKLILIFGERAIEIEGHNLGPLVDEIREGKLSSIRELSTARQALLRNSNPGSEPVIEGIRLFPDVEEILKQIKGEDKDDKADMLDEYNDDDVREVKALCERVLRTRDDDRKAKALETARAR